MNDFLLREFTHKDGVGMGIAYSDGRKLVSYSFGKANLDYNINISECSVFNIASIGKLVTSAIIFQLIEQGKFSLETYISNILNDIPQLWKPIQIRHLLTHSSGIKNYTSTKQYWEESRQDVSKYRIIDYIKKEQLDFEPGSGWEYNNTGFYLLGLITEKITGQSYFEFAEKNIFKPLNIHGISPTDYYSLIPNRVTGYQKSGENISVAPYYSNSGTFSAGGFSAKLTDFLLFEKALFEKKLFNNDSFNAFVKPLILSNGKRIKEEFTYLEFDDMCHGVFCFRYNGKTVYAHNGSIIGFSSAYIRVYEDNFSAIASTNTDEGELHHLLFKIYDQWIINQTAN